MGVGAAGGIVAYRKATHAVNGVRERTFRENLSKVAQTASSVATSARYLANLASDEQDATVVDIRPASGPRSTRVVAPDIRPVAAPVDEALPRGARR